MYLCAQVMGQDVAIDVTSIILLPNGDYIQHSIPAGFVEVIYCSTSINEGKLPQQKHLFES